MINHSYPHLIIAAILFLAAAIFPAASEETSNVDRLGVPGPVSFDGKDYALAAASHPQDNYFKQEYLPAGQGLDTYAHLFVIEAVAANITPKEAAATQIASLEQRKAKDPAVNHAVTVNEATGEVMLDFLISGASNGQIAVEWDAYRYAPLKGSKPGVIIYGISRRAYGETDARSFLTGLKDWRDDAIKTLVAFNAPAVTLKQ